MELVATARQRVTLFLGPLTAKKKPRVLARGFFFD
jgi:hypothetical protein